MIFEKSITGDMIEKATLVLIVGISGNNIRFMRPHAKDKWVVWVEAGVHLRLPGHKEAAKFDTFTDAYNAAANAKLVEAV